MRNSIENCLKLTKLWRCCEFRWSEYWHKKCDWKAFNVVQILEMLRVPLVTKLAREMQFNVFSTRANNVTSHARKISLKFVKKIQFSSVFSSVFIAPILWLYYSGPCNTSKAKLVLFKNFQAHFSHQIRFWRHSHHTVSEDCMFQSHITHQYRDNSVLAHNRI